MVPLARLDRYVLLLRQFLEGGGEGAGAGAGTGAGAGAGDGERGTIEQALKGMSSLAVSVEEQLSLEKNVNEVKRISKMLINYPGCLSEPGR